MCFRAWTKSTKWYVKNGASVFLEKNSQWRFSWVVIDGIQHLTMSLYLSSSGDPTWQGLGHFNGAVVSAQKALQGSETGARELLVGTKETRGHWFALQALDPITSGPLLFDCLRLPDTTMRGGSYASAFYMIERISLLIRDWGYNIRYLKIDVLQRYKCWPV